MLYCGFVELLDDVVPGMWAEMLGDRNFEGVVPTANWVYHLGALNLCDRDWDKNETWTYSTENPWNGAQSAKLTAAKDRPAPLTQSQLAVKKGMTYLFSGYFRGGSTSLDLSIRLKALLPDGQWMSLGQTALPQLGKDWTEISAKLTSTGTTDRAVLEIEADGQGILWADKLSLMPADNIDGWRRDVVEATKELRPPILRWGGSTIDPEDTNGRRESGTGIGGRHFSTRTGAGATRAMSASRNSSISAGPWAASRSSASAMPMGRRAPVSSLNTATGPSIRLGAR